MDAIPNGFTEGYTLLCYSLIATDSYALMIDDIEYEMAPIDIIAYNIYMDKNKIGNTAGISMFEQSNVPIGLHSFQVSAVYDVGESALSNVINLDIPTTIVNDIQKKQYLNWNNA